MTVRFVINRYGTLGTMCDATGDEFNPLVELDPYYEPAEHQDPSRGRLDGFTTDMDGKGAFHQKKLLQNLGGKESLLGKSITMLSVSAEEGVDDMLLDCCIIA